MPVEGVAPDEALPVHPPPEVEAAPEPVEVLPHTVEGDVLDEGVA